MDSLENPTQRRPVDQDETGIAFESEVNSLVMVAHPDDETLWAGGTMLMYPDWSWRVVALCRGKDRDRRPRFFSAMTRLGGRGSIGELDDGPDQRPLSDSSVQAAVRFELESTNFDLIVTHSPCGEYTRHRRHEEVGRAVLHLWSTGELTAKELWMFAYTDGGKAHYPRAIQNAHLGVALPEEIWRKKLAIIRDTYGFAPDSWEAMTTPRREAFWRFRLPDQALAWAKRESRNPVNTGLAGMDVGKGDKNESTGPVRLSTLSRRAGNPGGPSFQGASGAGGGRICGAL